MESDLGRRFGDCELENLSDWMERRDGGLTIVAAGVGEDGDAGGHGKIDLYLVKIGAHAISF